MKKLNRSIKRGDNGPDVLAVKRALKAGGTGKGIVLNRSFGSGLDWQVRQLQKKNALPIDGVYGDVTHKILLPFFDAYGLKLLSEAPKLTPAEQKYNKLLEIMEKVARDTPGYDFGGQHYPTTFDEFSTHRGMDCSSSCSYVLDYVGLWDGPNYAWVSGTFATDYGDAGGGRLFTVYANVEHVWIRLYKGKYWRFDTSPHGDGGRGPRLRRLPRLTSRFTARHWKGY